MFFNILERSAGPILAAQPLVVDISVKRIFPSPLCYNKHYYNTCISFLPVSRALHPQRNMLLFRADSGQ